MVLGERCGVIKTVLSAEWEPLLPHDMAEADAIADSIHTGLPERPEVFAEKRDLSPATCLKLVREQRIVGYGIAHPWTLFDVPALDTFLKALPASPTCLFVHDVAILPHARGQRSAARYIAKAARQARILGLAHLACVSVYGTDRLWATLGFKTFSSPEMRETIAGYGACARYMMARV